MKYKITRIDESFMLFLHENGVRFTTNEAGETFINFNINPGLLPFAILKDDNTCEIENFIIYGEHDIDLIRNYCRNKVYIEYTDNNKNNILLNEILVNHKLNVVVFTLSTCAYTILTDFRDGFFSNIFNIAHRDPNIIGISKIPRWIFLNSTITNSMVSQEPKSFFTEADLINSVDLVNPTSKKAVLNFVKKYSERCCITNKNNVVINLSHYEYKGVFKMINNKAEESVMLQQNYRELYNNNPEDFSIFGVTPDNPLLGVVDNTIYVLDNVQLFEIPYVVWDKAFNYIKTHRNVSYIDETLNTYKLYINSLKIAKDNIYDKQLCESIKHHTSYKAVKQSVNVKLQSVINEEHNIISNLESASRNYDQWYLKSVDIRDTKVRLQELNNDLLSNVSPEIIKKMQLIPNLTNFITDGSWYYMEFTDLLIVGRGNLAGNVYKLPPKVYGIFNNQTQSLYVGHCKETTEAQQFKLLNEASFRVHPHVFEKQKDVKIEVSGVLNNSVKTIGLYTMCYGIDWQARFTTAKYQSMYHLALCFRTYLTNYNPGDTAGRSLQHFPKVQNNESTTR